jgi:hypothetical protein
VIVRGLRESLRLAISIGGRRAALLPGGETAVDAVPVGIVGDDKHALLGLSSTGENEAKPDGETNRNCPHYETPVNWKRQAVPSAESKNVSKIVKRRLTLRSVPWSSNFSCILHGLRPDLDGMDATNHCAAMNGLNHICGICPEIIR